MSRIRIEVKPRKRRYLNAFLMTFALPALAQTPGGESGEGEDMFELEEIVVTATRTAMPAAETGTSISVLTADDLKIRQNSIVSDALRTLPSMNVNRNGGIGGSTSVTVRGVGNSKVLILIDGVEVNDASSSAGAFNFGNLTSTEIERIEVLRGSQGSLWGSDAIGGVVNIITRRPDKPLDTSMSLEGGSFGTRQARGSISGMQEKYSFRLAAGYDETDGISSADSANGNSETDGFRNYSVLAKGTLMPSDNFELTANLRYADSTSEFDSFDFAVGLIDGDENSTTEEVDGRVAGHLNLLDGDLENTFFATWAETDRAFLADGMVNSTFKGERRTFGYQGNYYFTPDQILTVGAETERDKMSNEDFQWGGGFSGKFDVHSVYGQIQSKFTDFLSANASLRYESQEKFGSATVFRLAAAADVSDTGATVRAAFGEGFKVPTTFQLFSSFGDPGLSPEESESWEIGILYATPDDRYNLEAGYFNIDVTNEVDFSFATFRYSNIARSKTEGFEFIIGANPIDGLQIDANYTYNKTRKNDEQVQGLRRPKHVINLQAAYQANDRLNVSLAMIYNSKERDSRGMLDAFTVVDLRAAYEITESISAFGRIENLLDANYQDVFGYGTPGLAAYGGLRYNF